MIEDFDEYYNNNPLAQKQNNYRNIVKRMFGGNYKDYKGKLLHNK